MAEPLRTVALDTKAARAKVLAAFFHVLKHRPVVLGVAWMVVLSEGPVAPNGAMKRFR